MRDPRAVAPRILADDVTPERLFGLLTEQGGRLGILSPEGGIFDLLAGRYSDGLPNLDAFLKAHSGDQLRVDRIGRPAEHLREPALTVGLAVQPAVIEGLADKPGFRGRGLLARFLYSMPRSLVGRRRVEDRGGREGVGPLLIDASKHLDTIRRLEFAAVVSHNHNDPPSWRDWTDKAGQDALIARFKKPLVHEDPAKQDGLAFLCVKSMLTTGFDAPVEQVLYLDRKVVAHELLQTIARVNRRVRGKDCGYIVDYIGVARHLHDALGDYDDETHDPMVDVRDEVPKLRDRHKRVLDVFLTRGISSIRDIEACVDLLADVKIRSEFINTFRLFLESLGIVMPRPEAVPYLRDAKILGFIAKVAANLYYDDQLNLYGVKHKVKALIDEYIAANGIDPKIPPIEILDVNFAEHVDAGKSAKARASRMMHAARHHISIHLHEDPTLFSKLSEKLEHILQDLKDNWTELERELRRFIDEELKQGREQGIEGLDPKVQAPFFGLLKEAIEATSGQKLQGDAFRSAVKATVETVDYVRKESARVGFWRDPPSRQRLENWVYRHLRRSGLVPEDKVQELAILVVDLAKSRHRYLTP